MMFIGRRAELEALETRWNSGKFELCITYGRRRVGKTTLIRHFIEAKPAIFWTALEIPASDNLALLSRAIFQNEERGNVTFTGFAEALEYIFKRAEQERLTFVIDEYPFLAESFPGFSSLLQKLIDEYKGQSKLFLIINGSSISLMEDYFSSYKHPLYGRKTCQIKVEPFGFFDACKFFPKVKCEELIYIYGALGGIPKYLEEYNTNAAFDENIIRNFLQKGAPLYDEPQSILKQEVRDAVNYNAVLGAIANGANRYSEIADKSGISSSAIAGFINNLMALNLVKKEAPVPDSGTKRHLYRLNDNMLRFWYTFIPQNSSLIAMGKSDIAWNLLQSRLDTYIGPVFEEIALEYLWHINGSKDLPLVFTNAGRWWGTNPQTKSEVEIDIVVVSNIPEHKDSALFCECKWHRQAVSASVLRDLIDKASLKTFESYSLKYYCLFSRSGFTDDCALLAAKTGNTLLITYEEMLET
jgi:AAA+ ATPase superfamily predicted ATPase